MQQQKIVLVTGASRGIGAATVRLLAKEGYTVAVNYAQSAQAADALVAEIVAGGGKAVAIQADIGVEADIVRLFAEADAKLGPMSALVNNAAVNLPGTGMALGCDAQALARVMAVNVTGVMLCCREAAQRMKETGGGAIVNVSSEAARFGGNAIAGYAASKGAVSTMTVGLARELAAHNIRVNAVSPGVIATDAHSGASPERLEGLRASIPCKRLGEPLEVAEAIAWLLSDKACYVSGAVLSVSGAR